MTSSDEMDRGGDEESVEVAPEDPIDESEFTPSNQSETLAVGEPEDDPEDIDTETLTIPLQMLNSKIQYIWMGRAAITAVVVGIIAYAVDRFFLGIGEVFGINNFVPIIVGVMFLVVGVVHSYLRYKVWRYEVREDALYLKRGVITQVRTVVPFVRIQHVDTSRGPIERLTGLASSVVYTAGSRGADVRIPGVEVERADELQHRLKKLAIAAEGETAV